MFVIFNGREQFYQWDQNQKLIVLDDTITEVHFCNRTDDCALIVEVKEIDGVRVADVPNILLTDNFPIKVYGYCGDCFTKKDATFKVVKRSKPSDYIYTETEVKNYEDFEERLKALEEKEVDLTDYVKNTDYATTAKGGVVKVGSGNDTGISIKDGQISLTGATDYVIEHPTGYNVALTSKNIYQWFRTGVTTNTLELTEDEQAAAQEWLGIGSIEEAIDAIIAIQENILSITFTILDYANNVKHTMKVEPNMTWGEWINSEYNTIGAYIEYGEYDTYVCVNNKMLYGDGTLFQLPTQTIVVDAEYWF